ncbi:hypothetical protein EDD17DRAFT_1511020 [Pisolithus thermaeus]|nr:hypothetical protein EV401DRAFT_1888709 [Pisolithus croceorrhizus]KAI6159768.1 hypothetical protein EDD17DRAFT_1511020 [Pisolithus thermaeus]
MTCPVGVSEPNLSHFPDDIELTQDAICIVTYLLQSEFIVAFAKRAVKVICLWPAVVPEQGAEILKLCQELQELTLQTAANQPDDENPLHRPLCALQPTTLSIDLASAFYGPTVFLPDLPLLCHIEHLHLTNSWVARIIVFNTAHFAEHAGPRNSFWEVVEYVVQWWEDNTGIREWSSSITTMQWKTQLCISYKCMVQTVVNSHFLNLSLPCPSLVEQMAKCNAFYLQMFDQHADLVRGRDAEEVTNAYHWVMNRGITSDTSPVMSLLASLLSLLLSQMEAMKKLPYDIMVKVDALTIELRSQVRDRKPALQQDKCALLTPPSPLLKLERPVGACHIPLSNTTICNMLALPSTLVRKQFILQDMDVYYCITSVTVSLKECMFSLQYEDLRCLHEGDGGMPDE